LEKDQEEKVLHLLVDPVDLVDLLDVDLVFVEILQVGEV